MDAKVEERKLLQRIAESAEDYPITQSPDWQELAAMSDETEFDGLRADRDSIIVADDNTFGGLMTVYVVRKYKGDEKFEESDSFPVTFEGRLGKTGEPVINSVSINTRSFYIGTGFEP